MFVGYEIRKDATMPVGRLPTARAPRIYGVLCKFVKKKQNPRIWLLMALYGYFYACLLIAHIGLYDLM